MSYTWLCLLEQKLLVFELSQSTWDLGLVFLGPPGRCVCVREVPANTWWPKAWMVADILGVGLDLRLRPRPVLGLPFF